MKKGYELIVNDNLVAYSQDADLVRHEAKRQFENVTDMGTNIIEFRMHEENLFLRTTITIEKGQLDENATRT